MKRARERVNIWDDEKEAEEDGDEEFVAPPLVAVGAKKKRKRNAEAASGLRIIVTPPPAPAPAKPPSGNAAEPPAQAPIDALRQKLRPDMQCPICMELITMAKTCERGHSICAGCYESMGGLGGSGTRLPCVTCKVVGAWSANLALTSMAETLFPEEFKARNKLAWIGAAGKNLVAEIRRRLDPKFDILADRGEYRRALSSIVQVAVEGGPNKAKRIHEMVVNRCRRAGGALRHFWTQVTPVTESFWGNALPLRSLFADQNEAFIVRLLDHVYSIIEFPAIMDDYEIPDSLQG